ncbi:MAG: hypothetical protein M1813_006159 [Trichoglossum hirsutum]|nr:MAG: hypothetical protein M1813_006159 [Trichoglossum hirsutum]
MVESDNNGYDDGSAPSEPRGSTNLTTTATLALHSSTERPSSSAATTHAPSASTILTPSRFGPICKPHTATPLRLLTIAKGIHQLFAKYPCSGAFPANFAVDSIYDRPELSFNYIGAAVRRRRIRQYRYLACGTPAPEFDMPPSSSPKEAPLSTLILLATAAPPRLFITLPLGEPADTDISQPPESEKRSTNTGASPAEPLILPFTPTPSALSTPLAVEVEALVAATPVGLLSQTSTPFTSLPTEKEGTQQYLQLTSPSALPLEEPTGAGTTPPTPSEEGSADILSMKPLIPLAAPIPSALSASFQVKGEEPADIPPVEPLIQPHTPTSTLLISLPTEAEEPTTNTDVPSAELSIPLAIPTPSTSSTPLPAEEEKLTSSLSTNEESTSEPFPAKPTITQKPAIRSAEAEHEKIRGIRRIRLRHLLGFFCVCSRAAEG